MDLRACYDFATLRCSRHGTHCSSRRIFRFGQFEADASRGILIRGGSKVKLQDQPFRVLILLLERPSEIVTREELRHELWPEGTFVDFDGSLNVIVKKLRAALDDDPDNPRFVETVPRRGYRFIAPVATEGTDAGPLPFRRGVVPDGSAPFGIDTRTPTADIFRSRSSRPLLYGLSAVVLLLLAGLGWYVRRNAPPAKTAPLRPKIRLSPRCAGPWQFSASTICRARLMTGGWQLLFGDAQHGVGCRRKAAAGARRGRGQLAPFFSLVSDGYTRAGDCCTHRCSTEQ